MKSTTGTGSVDVQQMIPKNYRKQHVIPTPLNVDTALLENLFQIARSRVYPRMLGYSD